MAHAVDDFQPRAGNESGASLSANGPKQPVLCAVNNLRGRSHVPEPLFETAGGDNGVRLAKDASGAKGPVKGAFGELA